LLHRVLAIFVGLGDLLAANPILGTIYLVTLAALGQLTMWFVWRGEPRRAFLAGWREVGWSAQRGLAPIAILSMACMVLVVFDIEPWHIATLSKGAWTTAAPSSTTTELRQDTARL
jgi:hypothetical protein